MSFRYVAAVHLNGGGFPKLLFSYISARLNGVNVGIDTFPLVSASMRKAVTTNE